MRLSAPCSAASRLKDVQAAAEAAAIAMQREVAAEVTSPPRTDPKIAVMNLVQASTGISLYTSLTSRLRCAPDPDLQSRTLCRFVVIPMLLAWFRGRGAPAF